MGLDRTNSPRLRRLQPTLAMGLLCCVALSAIALDLIARNPGLASWLDHDEYEFCRQTGTVFEWAGYFDDCDDRFVNEVLPQADYTRGGVYLVGSSVVGYGSRFWELRPPESELVHNYALRGSSNVTQLMFLRYLIERAGLLRAGNDKTLLIYGVNYMRYRDEGIPEGYISKLWGRHGLYACDLEQGIRPLQVNPVVKALRLERLRIAGCVRRLEQYVARRWMLWRHGLGYFHQKPNRQEYIRGRVEMMGADWKEKIQSQAAALGRFMDYLRAERVQVLVVLMPEASWEFDMPYERAFVVETAAVCNQRHIPLLDWSKLLKDDDFGDGRHANAYGSEKTQAEFLRIARDFLHATHALP